VTIDDLSLRTDVDGLVHLPGLPSFDRDTEPSDLSAPS